MLLADALPSTCFIRQGSVAILVFGIPKFFSDDATDKWTKTVTSLKMLSRCRSPMYAYKHQLFPLLFFGLLYIV